MNYIQMKDLINDGFGRLYPLTFAAPAGHVDWRDYRELMLDDEIKQEKQHRKEYSFDLNSKFSVNLIAKYFVIKAIRSISTTSQFRPRDILHCTKSHLYAHALRDDDRFDIDGMMNDFDWAAFDAIEYSQADLICGA